MKTIYVVLGESSGKTGVLNVGASTSRAAGQLKRGCRLDRAKVIPVEVAETDAELLEWLARSK